MLKDLLGPVTRVKKRKRRVPAWCCVSGLGSRVWFQGSGKIRRSSKVSGFGFRVAGFRFRGSGFRHRVSGFGFRVSDFGFQVSGFGFRVSGFGFRGSGFGIRDSGFGFRVSGFGFRVWGERAGTFSPMRSRERLKNGTCNGSNVIPRRALPGLAGRGPHTHHARLLEAPYCLRG